MRNDLPKQLMYESVKTLVECQSSTILLPQAKLYTLCSIGFQYLLYNAVSDPGNYIIRVEDSFLTDKIARNAKDDSTRKFFQRLNLPRKLKYQGATFHLDFFNVATWANTNELPKENIKGALIIKNTESKPIGQEEDEMISALPKDFHIQTLDFVPKRVIISYNDIVDNSEVIKFPFIKDKESEALAKGVHISDEIDFSSID